MPPQHLSPLREAAWLTSDRATVAGWMLLAGLAAIMATLLGTARNGINILGVPIGGDFTCIYTASRMALRGAAALAYDIEATRAAQIEVMGGDYGFLPFFYPPLWLLLCLPLALVPYGTAQAAFVAGTALACWRSLRSLRPEGWAVLPLLAFPAFWTNAAYGQNGFLSTALLAGAVHHLDKRPAIAGLCFGLLAYKPQLGLAVPLALAAAGRWRAFLAAAATVLGLAALATLLLGAGIWGAWIGSLGIAGSWTEQGALQHSLSASWFGAVRLAGGGVGPAYAVQAAIAVSAAGLLIVFLRRRPGAMAEGALIVATTPLLTHYVMEYDLAILAIPMGWLMAGAAHGGFLPWERLGLAAVFAALPFGAQIASSTGFQLLPFATATVFLLVLQRLSADAGAEAVPPPADSRTPFPLRTSLP